MAHIFRFGQDSFAQVDAGRFANARKEFLFHAKVSNKDWNKKLKTLMRCWGRESKEHLEAIMCLKIYCDNNRFQRKFRLVYHQYQLEQAPLFFNWNKLFVDTFRFYTVTNRACYPRTVYHGTQCSKMECRYEGVFHGPLSTTDDRRVARHFAGRSGIVLEITPNWDKSEFGAISVRQFSSYSDENEFLLFNAFISIH